MNDNERGTLNYYLNEYQKGHVTVDSLVLALSQLLNTPSKVWFRFLFSVWNHFNIKYLSISSGQLTSCNVSCYRYLYQQFSLMTEIQGLILPRDIDRFDAEVTEREVEAIKVRDFWYSVVFGPNYRPTKLYFRGDFIILNFTDSFQGTADDISEQSLDTLSGNSQLSYGSNRVSIANVTTSHERSSDSNKSKMATIKL